MIDLKQFIQNPQALAKHLQKRHSSIEVDHLLKLYEEYKQASLKAQKISAERNAWAKKIGELVRLGQDATSLKDEVRQTKPVEEAALTEANEKYKALEDALLYVPNVLDDAVPEGADEASNLVVRTVGTPPNFSFQPKSHYQLAEDLGVLDFKRASQISGSRFAILSGGLARLERALTNFMLDLHTSEHGFVEYVVPVLVNQEALVGTSQLPKFAEDMFRSEETGKWLVSTGEIPLTNLVRAEILNRSELPLRFTAATQCFRKEAGARGKDTKGLIRQHQFNKVELVSICLPEQGPQELEHILNSAENVLKKLELPYRVSLLCGGDIGFAAQKTYDLEVWLPSEGRYREISSCSWCGDFQARRMGAKYQLEGSKSKPAFVHTLNGSGLAVGRTVVAILENYQQADGNVAIPEVLRPYMGSQARLI